MIDGHSGRPLTGRCPTRTNGDGP